MTMICENEHKAKVSLATAIKMNGLLANAAVALAMMGAPGVAQERCITEARQDITSWAAQNGALLEDLWNRFDNSVNPNAEVVNYRGTMVPLTYALEQETARFQSAAVAVRDREISQATDCARALEVAIPRATWDFARTPLTWVLPERATRIDFEEIRRGNFLGGDHSIGNEVIRGVEDIGRTIDETFNPFRW